MQKMDGVMNNAAKLIDPHYMIIRRLDGKGFYKNQIHIRLI